jgi:glucosamine--fructose-6-phosphate aminotransferase (isomerizing)
MHGDQLEREILEQPEAWERVASSDAAARLAAALEGEIVLVGSGSSLFAAQLGAVALRRRGIVAHAVAATEAQNDCRAYRGRVVVALSQSGRSTDLLRALDTLAPRRTIALTNTIASPLGERADLTIDILAGPERAIPATKSVTCTVAILLAAASHFDEHPARNAAALHAAAEDVRAWFGDGLEDVRRAAAEIAIRHDIVILGTDYGACAAREAALKFKESTYLHAEGFEAGEFRHGSAAMLDASSVVLAILDRDAREIVGRPLREAAARHALRYAIGTETIDDVPRLGPVMAEPYNVLGWLAAVQMLALHVARSRGIDPDVPRGLSKAVVTE